MADSKGLEDIDAGKSASAHNTSRTREQDTREGKFLVEAAQEWGSGQRRRRMVTKTRTTY
jgi:hypothetical protein